MSTRARAISLASALLLLPLGGCFQHFARERAVDHYVTALSLRSAALDEDAVAQLQEAVRLDDEFSLAHSMLGDLYREQGNYEGAATAYENACHLDPWAFKDHFNLGSVYKVLKRFADAIEVLKRACQLQPDHSQANYTLGVCYYETEEYDQAARFCQRAAELEPQNDQILASLGAIYGKAGDDHKAIRAYKQALEINPADEQVMIKMGLVYVRMKRFGPARLILEKAVGLAPEKPETHLNLAYCLFVEREVDGAVERYRRVIELDGENYKAYNGIAACHMMMYLADRENIQMCRDGLENWHRSLEISPQQPRIQRLVKKYTKQLYPPDQNAPITP